MPAAPARAAPLPPLEDVLQKLGRVATLYRDTALRFTCDETIYFSGYGSPQIHRFKYIYRYSDADERLLDYRTARGRAERKSAKKQEKARLANYGLPTFLQRAYSWVFVFYPPHQQKFRYEIVGLDETGGVKTLRIRFEAIPPYENGINEWRGTAWIDRKNYQMVRVEAPPEPSSPRGGSYTFTEVVTEFDVLKNGMRFPGRVVMKNATHVVNATHKVSVRESPNFTITQTYGRYRFFGVRTAEQIQRIVEGD